MNRGQALRDRGGRWNADAIRWFCRAIAARPEAIDPLLDIAQAHFKQRHYWRARRWYARIVRGRPDCFEAWRRGADCFPRDAHMRRACWLLRAYVLSPGDMGVLNELTYHLGQLSNLRRWRLYQAFWRAYDAVWPAVQRTKQPYGFWKLPFMPVSKEWELMIREWASNKRAGIKPFTGAGPAGRFRGMDGAWTG